MPDGAEIEIRDNGTGLPPDWIDAISGQDEGKVASTPIEGVGLVLAREIVLLHRGKLLDRVGPRSGRHSPLAFRRVSTGPTTRPGEDTRAARIRSSETYRYGRIQDETGTWTGHPRAIREQSNQGLGGGR